MINTNGTMRTLGAAAAALLLAAALFSGCGDDDGGPAAPDTDYDFSAILDDYARNVVVATYTAQAAKAAALVAVVDDMAAAPAKERDAGEAAAAWKEVREPWESGEAFLFGPAATLGLDPALDSWPVDRQQLDDVLASDFELTAGFVTEGLGPALRGFHTIEFLLFEGGAPRDGSAISGRELEYLGAVTAVLRADSESLRDAWESGAGGAQPYAGEFAAAGTSGSRYRTQRDAVLEIVEGMIAICDEVANGKIADPYDEGDVTLVESQFSHNSLDDFANNMRSVQNAYLGGYHLGATRGAALADFVAEKDTDLDARLRGEIEAAIEAIEAIPFPFRDNLGADDEITAAQGAIVTILNTLESDVKPLIFD